MGQPCGVSPSERMKMSSSALVNFLFALIYISLYCTITVSCEKYHTVQVNHGEKEENKHRGVVKNISSYWSKLMTDITKGIPQSGGSMLRRHYRRLQIGGSNSPTILMTSKETISSGLNTGVDYPEAGVFLQQQIDGNLRLHMGTPGMPSHLLWETGFTSTSMGFNYFTKLQSDGNLLTKTGTPNNPGVTIWSTGGNQINSSYFLQLSPDKRRISIIQGDGREVWFSMTNLPFVANTIPTILLRSGEIVGPGQSIYFADTNVSWKQQENGKLILYRGSPEVPESMLWESNYQSTGQGHYFSKLQRDGNFLTKSGTPENSGETVWKTGGTGGGSPSDYFLELNADMTTINLFHGTPDNRQGIVWSSNCNSPVHPTPYPTCETPTPYPVYHPTPHLFPSNAPVFHKPTIIHVPTDAPVFHKPTIIHVPTDAPVFHKPTIIQVPTPIHYPPPPIHYPPPPIYYPPPPIHYQTSPPSCEKTPLPTCEMTPSQTPPTMTTVPTVSTPAPVETTTPSITTLAPTVTTPAPVITTPPVMTTAPTVSTPAPIETTAPSIATPEPTPQPVVTTPEPTRRTPAPTESDTPEPTQQPVITTPSPTRRTPGPTESGTPEPTPEPTPQPVITTPEPTRRTPGPTDNDTPEPTPGPTASPTASPTPRPTNPQTPGPTPDPTLPTPSPPPTPGICLPQVSITCETIVEDGETSISCEDLETLTDLQCAQGRDLRDLTLSWKAASCDESNNGQMDIFECTDFAAEVPEGDQAIFLCYDTTDRSSVYCANCPTLKKTKVTQPGVVLPESLTCEISTRAGEIVQNVTFNTSGNRDLRLKDTFGSITIDGCREEGISAEKTCCVDVRYIYFLQNTGPTDFTIVEYDRTCVEKDDTINLLERLPSDQVEAFTAAPPLQESNQQLDICSQQCETKVLRVVTSEIDCEDSFERKDCFSGITPRSNDIPRSDDINSMIIDIGTGTSTAIRTNDINTPPTTPERTTRVFGVISSVALEGGEEFEDPYSYQSKALEFVQNDPNNASYSDEQIIQRYSLGCYYYNTFGVRNSVTDAELGGPVTPSGWLMSNDWVTYTRECDWYGITCNDQHLVVEIAMARNRLTGFIPPEVGLLSPSLEQLDLYNNNHLQAGIGENGNAWIGRLTNLKRLYHAFCKFESSTGVPTEIGLLTNLEQYDCAFNLYEGALQDSMWTNLRKLVFLDISGGKYQSVIPDQLLQLPLEHFFMTDAHIADDVSYLTSLTKLIHHKADRNPGITGQLSEGYFLNRNIEVLSFSDCSLTGTIPSSISELYVPVMKHLFINGNEIGGQVPTELGTLTSLEKFNLEDNNIAGTMPSEVCALRIIYGLIGDGLLQELIADCAENSFGQTKLPCNCCTECYSDV